MDLRCPESYYVRGIKMTFGKVQCSCDDPEPNMGKRTDYLGDFATYSCSDGSQGYCNAFSRCVRSADWEKDGDYVPDDTCEFDMKAAVESGFRRAELDSAEA